MSRTPRPNTMSRWNARNRSFKLTLSGGVLDCTPKIFVDRLRVMLDIARTTLGSDI